MAYDKNELLSLPDSEKVKLAEELWGSVEENLLPDKYEIEFAEERLQMHEANPNEGMSLAMFKKYFSDKYGV